MSVKRAGCRLLAQDIAFFCFLFNRVRCSLGLVSKCPNADPAARADTRAGPQVAPSSACEWSEGKGIEVAHAFLLGTKYSHVFDASFQDESSKKQYVCASH